MACRCYAAWRRRRRCRFHAYYTCITNGSYSDLGVMFTKSCESWHYACFFNSIRNIFVYFMLINSITRIVVELCRQFAAFYFSFAVVRLSRNWAHEKDQRWITTKDESKEWIWFCSNDISWILMREFFTFFMIILFLNKSQSFSRN